MKKLRKTIKAIGEIVKNPWLLNRVLDDDSVWKRYLSNKYRLEHGLPVVDFGDLCPDFEETLDYFAFLDGGSLPTDIALLKTLSRRFDHCAYFEIGTWRGESVANVAACAAECYTLNLSKAEMLSIGLSEQYTDLHGFFSKGKANITHLTGNSMTYDFAGLDKKFDLIFIDGNHHYEFVKNDTAKVFEHLIHDQSIIVWHDYAYTPEKWRPEVMAAILDGTPAIHQKHLYHVSNTMCAIFTREQVVSQQLVTPVIPCKTFKVTVQQKSLD